MMIILFCILLTAIALSSFFQNKTPTAQPAPSLIAISNPQLVGISHSRLDRLDLQLQKLIKDDFSDYLTNHLFKPPGMTDTYFYLPE